MATTSVNPERQRMLDYLEGFGIDGRHVCKVEPDGYYRIEYPSDDEFFKIPWPDLLDYDWLARLKEVADKADLRRAGIRVVH